MNGHLRRRAVYHGEAGLRWIELRHLPLGWACLSGPPDAMQRASTGTREDMERAYEEACRRAVRDGYTRLSETRFGVAA